jgi:hypothetical protein
MLTLDVTDPNPSLAELKQATYAHLLSYAGDGEPDPNKGKPEPMAQGWSKQGQ